MSAPRKRGSNRQRGTIQALPSGALRARVYSGVDPLSGKRVYLTETIGPDHPQQEKEAERALTRLLSRVDEKRAPRTRATVNKLMDRYLDLINVEETTRSGYEGYIKNHIRPLLGRIQVGKLDGETLDSFYAVLRRCRKHCDGRKFTEHAEEGAHECSAKCKPHTCKPLAASSIRQIHGCLSGALSRAQKWNWITVNPLERAETPKAPKADPHPPTAAEAASIINTAFLDLAWGVLVWMAMVTGARRGEICAMRWDLLDFDKSVLTIRTSVAQRNSKTWEKDTKAHQQRRIALDETTVAILQGYKQHCASQAKSVGATLDPKGRIFAPDIRHSQWIKPSTVTQRYRRMCARLGWDMHIHQLRHYSATELISAGVDIRTVAGRLGHGGGGTTTLKVYAAWSAEADQRAAASLTAHMPTPPIAFASDGLPKSSTEKDAKHPYEVIAAHLRGAILCDAIKVGETLPAIATIARKYNVANSTVHRAIQILEEAGLVEASRGKRTTVISAVPSDVAPVISLHTKRKA